MKLLWTCEEKHLHSHMFTFFLGKSLGAGLLGLAVNVHLTYEAAKRLFCQQCELSMFPFLTNTWVLVQSTFNMLATPADAQWHLTVVLICIFLMNKDLKHFYACFLAIHTCSLVKCLGSCFLGALFVFSLTYKCSLYTIKPCYQIWVLQIYVFPDVVYFLHSAFQRRKVFNYNKDQLINFLLV